MTAKATPAEIAEAKHLWEANTLSIDAICKQVGRSAPWLYHQAGKGQWTGRRTKSTSLNQIAAAKEKRAEEAARDGVLFGPLLDDVRFLRQRDFTITVDGKKLSVDGKSINHEDFRALADRERRLMQPAPVAAVQTVRKAPAPILAAAPRQVATVPGPSLNIVARLDRLEARVEELFTVVREALANRKASLAAEIDSLGAIVADLSVRN